MVQKRIYVQRKAEELKTGDMFVHWAILEDGLYPEPRPIVSIHTFLPTDSRHIFKKSIVIHVKNDVEEELLALCLGMIVVVQEVA